MLKTIAFVENEKTKVKIERNAYEDFILITTNENKLTCFPITAQMAKLMIQALEKYIK